MPLYSWNIKQCKTAYFCVLVCMYDPDFHMLLLVGGEGGGRVSTEVLFLLPAEYGIF